jgi:hypothetical protein
LTTVAWRDIEGKLAKIRTITPIGLQVLDRIIARALELRSQAETDGVVRTGNPSPLEPTSGRVAGLRVQSLSGWS